MCSGFSTRSSTSRPTISPASERSVAPSVGTVSIFSPRRRTVTRSAMSSTSLSLCEMKTTDVPCSVSVRRTSNRSCASCGGEHRGRLVEDQHLRAAEQRAQDLHALLGADADVLDLRVRVHRQAERCESSRTRAAAAL